MLKYIEVLCFILILANSIYSAKLPSNWKKCSAKDPKVNECLKEAITIAVKDLTSDKGALGIPSVNSVPVTSLKLNQGQGPVSLNLNLINITISGIKNLKINDVRLEKNVDIILDFDAPNLNINGKYNVSGKILALPIVGDGDIVLVTNEAHYKGVMHLKEITKNGKKCFNIEEFKLEIIKWGKKGNVHLDNLFNGDKTLGKTMNLALNENWDQLTEEVGNDLTKALAAVYKDVGNRILNKIPSSEILK